MNRIFFAILISIFALVMPVRAAEPAKAEISKEKKAEIEKTLRLVGVEKLMGQMKTQMFEMFRQESKNVPEEFWKRAEQKFDTAELVEKIIPLYDKYYTMEDLKALNAFYESPAGQKVLGTLPQLMQESLKIGQAWGEEVGKRVQNDLVEEMRGRQKDKKEKTL